MTLKDTALCAIVRDEMINPAGGIIDFIESTVPFVEEAIVVDGLSVDGTREALEEMQAKYPHLKVFERRFTGYASQRNFSLEQATAKYALVLDADERLMRKDFAQLKELMEREKAFGYNFKFRRITPENPKGNEAFGHNPRLFMVCPEVQYEGAKRMSGEMGEFLYFGQWRVSSRQHIDMERFHHLEILSTDIEIKHFEASEEANGIKQKQWYLEVVLANKSSEVSSSQVPESTVWKAYDPAVRERGGDEK